MASPPVEKGVTLSGRLLSEEIGHGGFSRVFRAEPVGGGPAVAIKVAIRPELVVALRSEGAVLRRLKSPHFVEILEEHLEDDPPYFVLELCPGGDLRALLERSPTKRLDPTVAEPAIVAVLEGMAFAHDEGFVHGDLKPENVLLDGRGEPKIADLGLSRAHRKELLVGAGVQDSLETKDDGKVRGTFDYLAPEVRAGQDLSPASDVYALGVLLYELLTGKRPLGVFALPQAALAREQVAIPAYFDRVCARALAHDARERYPDAGVMLADLKSGATGIELGSFGGAASSRVAAHVFPRVLPDAISWTNVGLAATLPVLVASGTASVAASARSFPWGAALVYGVASIGFGFLVHRHFQRRRRP